MRFSFFLACLLALAGGCAGQAKTNPAQPLVAQRTAAAASGKTRLPEQEESFERRIRRRTNQALESVGATADQKTAVEELLLSHTQDLYACVGGRERVLLKTLSILAASQNQGEVLDALEKADIPLSDHCLMLGSDLITRFSEVLTPKQREQLQITWQQEEAL